MEEKRKNQIKNVLETVKFKLIPREELSIDVNILPGRFVLSLNYSLDLVVKCMSRYVIGGNRDKM